jgi:hypothetical protein
LKPKNNENKMTIPLNQVKLLAVAFAVGVVTSFSYGSCSGETKALRQYNKEFQTYQTTIVKPALAFGDSLKTENKKLELQRDSLSKITNNQRSKIDVLDGRLAEMGAKNRRFVDSVLALSLPPECEPLKLAITDLQKELMSKDEQIVNLKNLDSTNNQTILNLKSSLRNSERRADSLNTVIIFWPKPPKPRKFISFFPEISGNKAFVLGAIAGAAAAHYVEKHQ